MRFTRFRAVGTVVVATIAVLGMTTAASGTEDVEDPEGVEDAEPSVVTWGIVPAGEEGPDGRSAFDYELDSGEATADWVAVSNHSDEDLTLAVYAHDAFTTVAGGFDLLPADTEPIGVGAWAELDAATVAVPAQSRVTVPFELSVPENATPGDHAGGIVASLASAAEDDAGDQVLVEHRVGARIYLRVSGELDPVFEIEELEASYAGTLNPFGMGAVTTTFTVHNTGNVRLTGLPQAATTGPFGLGRRAAEGDELPEILPGGSFTTEVSVDRVLPLVRIGTAVEIDPVPIGLADTDLRTPLAQDSSTVWAVPWTQFVMLLIVVGAVVWYIRRRRRNAAKFAEALERARDEGAAAARAATSGAETPSRPARPEPAEQT